MRTAWIPEAPNHPGLYANRRYRSFGEGHAMVLTTVAIEPSTMDPHKARQFDTLQECQVWCDANPSPAFAPKEHGFHTQEI